MRDNHRSTRTGEATAKGYDQGDFTESFERYLSSEGQSKRDSVTTPGFKGESPNSQSVTDVNPVTEAKANEVPANIELSRCHASTAPVPEERDELLL